MATSCRRDLAAQRHWDPTEYVFDPYNLTSVHVSEATSPSRAEACTADAAAAAAAAEAVLVKRPADSPRCTAVLCQVPGCLENLAEAQKYYWRYRICQRHCDMPALMIDGLRQRFCQQCGRFHDVAEFEGANCSCKRKLKRHN